MATIIFQSKSLNPVTLSNYGRPHKIVQVNALHDLYDIIVIEIFMAKE